MNRRDDLLPYHFLKHTNFKVGCNKFDKEYVDKELDKKGIESFGVFHNGPASSALTEYLLPHYVSRGITIPSLSDCVA